MVEYTPNHELAKWEEGDTEWTHAPDMQKIEERLVIRDEETNLENYSPYSSATFVATDTGAVYDGDGSSWNGATREIETVSTSNVTVSDSVTWPDGSTTTTSPTGVGKESYHHVPAGIVYRDSNGSYVAESFVTEEVWRDENDTGTVLQSLLDAINEARGGNSRIGEIEFGVGKFSFDSPVVLDDHVGTTLTGQSFRQSNRQSATELSAGSLPAGRGIIEVGRVGAGSGNAGSGEATHIRQMCINLNGQDAAGIYCYGQDRLRTDDVKVDNVGAGGNGILMIGSFNSSLINSYFNQAALLSCPTLSKDNNSLRLHNVTFNSNNAGHPPLILGSSGTRITNSIFNGVDGPSLQDGIAVVSEDDSSTGILSSDSRLSSSDIDAEVKRFQAASCTFVTGGSDVRVFNSVNRAEITASRFSSSGIAIANFNRLTLSSCRFTEVGKEALYRPGNSAGGVSAITGCEFKNFGQDNGEPAIRFGDTQTHRTVVSGNSFRSTNGAANDIVLEHNSDAIVVTGNFCSSGISASIGAAKVGDSRDVVSKVVANSANPVGFSRNTPSVPGGTGRQNSVPNLNCQGAWIYHNGSGVNVSSFGDRRSLSVDSSPVFVPRAGEIWFTQSAPSAWDWWWL